jgi:hypothetical protein
MLKQMNKLDKQYGGSIPFSAVTNIDNPKKKKSKRKTKINKFKKRSISPSRAHRKITKKMKRSKKKTHKNKTPKKCSCGTHTYTGSENTPYGLGKCSKCLPKRVVMKGRDKKLYENTENGWRNLT